MIDMAYIRKNNLQHMLYDLLDEMSIKSMNGGKAVSVLDSVSRK